MVYTVRFAFQLRITHWYIVSIFADKNLWNNSSQKSCSARLDMISIRKCCLVRCQHKLPCTVGCRANKHCPLTLWEPFLSFMCLGLWGSGNFCSLPRSSSLRLYFQYISATRLMKYTLLLGHSSCLRTFYLFIILLHGVLCWIHNDKL